MNAKALELEHDIWSDWLLRRRLGSDPANERVVRPVIDRIADRVLDGARLEPRMTLADVGSGDGLIAFRAIERVGPSLRVHFADISAPLLRRAESLATDRGVRAQCTFQRSAAARLEHIADASVDVVTTRAVLAYVADKAGALREFHRVLKPGGRISIGEPVFRDDALAVCALKASLGGSPDAEDNEFLELLHRFQASQYPASPEAIANSPITNYSERDLFGLVIQAGFASVHLELHVDAAPSAVTDWNAFLASSPHPLAPSGSAILEALFSPEERRVFETRLRPRIESGGSLAIERVAYVTGVKPIPDGAAGRAAPIFQSGGDSRRG